MNQTEPAVYSFVFDRQSSLESFKQIGKRELVFSMLAKALPQSDWEGCLVYLGESPAVWVATACVGTQGPAADQVQVKLVEALERLDIVIREVYEGGPEPTQKVAVVRGGAWASPEQ